MEKFSLHSTDSKFRISTKPKAYDDLASARAAGIEGGSAIASDEIRAGSPTSVVEVCVEDADSVVVDRSIVSMSVSKLQSDGDVADPV